MFVTRLISGIVLVAVMLAVTIPGGPVLGVFLALISLIGLFELYRAFGIERTAIALVGYGTALVHYVLLMTAGDAFAMAVCLAGLLVMMAVYVFGWPRYTADQVFPAYAGILYVPVLMSHIYLVRAGEDGTYLVWLIFLAAWGCDTCAYCVGRLIGRHKLAPVLSPKKSVEGGIGGVVGAGLLGLLYGYLFRGQLTEFSNPALHCMIVCAAGGVLSQIGDLAASGIKRNRGIKDYGRLIPGHGGILDRFDSILFTAPVIYYLVCLLQALD